MLSAWACEDTRFTKIEKSNGTKDITTGISICYGDVFCFLSLVLLASGREDIIFCQNIRGSVREGSLSP